MIADWTVDERFALYMGDIVLARETEPLGVVPKLDGNERMPDARSAAMTRMTAAPAAMPPTVLFFI